jgi:hypothetical protein
VPHWSLQRMNYRSMIQSLPSIFPSSQQAFFPLFFDVPVSLQRLLHPLFMQREQGRSIQIRHYSMTGDMKLEFTLWC